MVIGGRSLMVSDINLPSCGHRTTTSGSEEAAYSHFHYTLSQTSEVTISRALVEFGIEPLTHVWNLHITWQLCPSTCF